MMRQLWFIDPCSKGDCVWSYWWINSIFVKTQMLAKALWVCCPSRLWAFIQSATFLCDKMCNLTNVGWSLSIIVFCWRIPLFIPCIKCIHHYLEHLSVCKYLGQTFWRGNLSQQPLVPSDDGLITNSIAI